LSLE